jgi:hypothetical protein
VAKKEHNEVLSHLLVLLPPLLKRKLLCKFLKLKPMTKTLYRGEEMGVGLGENAHCSLLTKAEKKSVFGHCENRGQW